MGFAREDTVTFFVVCGDVRTCGVGVAGWDEADWADAAPGAFGVCANAGPHAKARSATANKPFVLCLLIALDKFLAGITYQEPRAEASRGADPCDMTLCDP